MKMGRQILLCGGPKHSGLTVAFLIIQKLTNKSYCSIVWSFWAQIHEL